MKIIKKIITLNIVLVMIINALTYGKATHINATANLLAISPVKVGVLLNNFYNPYNLLIKKSLEDIEMENKNEVKFTFFDGKGDPATESGIISNMITDNYDILFLGVVDTRGSDLVDDSISKARPKNLPLIFINVIPEKLDAIKRYPKSLSISTDSIQAATLQGKMIIDTWNNNKQNIDKNNDDILQYVLLEGQKESYASIVRSKYSIATINKAGIKTQELAKVSANWSTEIAEDAIEPLFIKYGNKIEAIISDNDAMAIGAINVLQKYGYNKGNKEKTISVFGIGGIPEAQELIKKDFMAGTVPQDTKLLADALYSIGMNLVSGKYPLEDTKYKFDETGVVVRIPFGDYISSK